MTAATNVKQPLLILAMILALLGAVRVAAVHPAPAEPSPEALELPLPPPSAEPPVSNEIPDFQQLD
jgi:hypothetical protein